MKRIDENYFKQENGVQLTVNDLLESHENILWKGKPKKSSYVLGKSLGMMPIAIIWGAIDFTILFTVLGQGGIDAPMVIFLIFFFALHLMPVWIWLGSMLKAAKEMNSIEYIITNKRIIEIKGVKSKYIEANVRLSDLSGASLKVSIIDKILKVGDIYVTGKNNKKVVLFDIPNCEFITNKIAALCADKNNTEGKKEEFYRNNHECSHCGTYFDADAAKCPSCGAPADR